MATDGCARAKINLALHVTGHRADGLHDLDSLVVFAEVCDRVTVERGAADQMQITGPFAERVPDGPDNLIWRAIALLGARQDGLTVTLEKNLPVASGIGGGTADAAAALHLAAAVLNRNLPKTDALMSVGADLPVCLSGRAARMSGAGADIVPVAGLPQLHMVLVNPGVAVSTAAVFGRLEGQTNAPLTPLPEFMAEGTLIAWLGNQRNDLQHAAIELAPEIGACLRAMAQTQGCQLARMSGSGATCFGIYASAAAAAEAAQAVQDRFPGMWVKATRTRPS